MAIIIITIKTKITKIRIIFVNCCDFFFGTVILSIKSDFDFGAFIIFLNFFSALKLISSVLQILVSLYCSKFPIASIF